jgi:3-hydroxyacyl-CoA dehydrogenase
MRSMKSWKPCAARAARVVQHLDHPARTVDRRAQRGFARDFLITHFFNPPRYMRLLEVVAGRQRSRAGRQGRRFRRPRAGQDRGARQGYAGFLANRVGTFWIQQAINAAIDLGLSVEEADAVVGKPMGVPKTGVFGLVDLVGIDLMPHLKASLTATLPADDAYRAIAVDHPLITKMIADGYTGRKGKGGFYRLNREAGKRKEAIDLATGEYRAAAKPPSLPGAVFKDLKALVGLSGKLGAYAWAVLGPTLSYAASLVPQASDDIVAIDVAMKLGYNWKFGPFELIDKLGTAAFAQRLQAEGKPVPAIVELAAGRPFYRVEAASARRWALMANITMSCAPTACCCSKTSSFRPSRCSRPLRRRCGTWAMASPPRVHRQDERARCRSDEADRPGDPAGRRKVQGPGDLQRGQPFLGRGQPGPGPVRHEHRRLGRDREAGLGRAAGLKALKYAPFPVVGAPAGMALGGGCEVLLHCDAIQAHAESYIGLVECGVGLVPGWGGNGEMLDRWRPIRPCPRGRCRPWPRSSKRSRPPRCPSLPPGDRAGFLRPTDQVTMNRDRLLADAKARVLALAEGYQPPEPPVFRLPGAGGKTALDMAVEGFRARGMATPHDEVVSGALARILTGGDADVIDTVTEEDLLAAERHEFTSWCAIPRHRPGSSICSRPASRFATD